MKVQLCILFILVCGNHTSATNYYLSSRGSDLQSGTNILAPWRSLKKLSEVIESLQPGDSIFFERGSAFSGTLKTSVSGKLSREIYIGAYGLGAKPIVTGAIEIKNWTLFHGNIWVADCTQCNTEPGDLFMDGRCLSLGRYPNDDYLTLSCTSQYKTRLTDEDSMFADSYWDGAEVVVKSSRWTIDRLPVVNYFNKAFYFGMEASYPLPNGHGYFIQKHLATLDKHGEWYFDKASKKIFLYCKNGDKPTGHSMEASISNTGLSLENSNFITIENIAFNYQRIAGAQIAYGQNISLRNCDVNYSGNNGVEIVSCQNPVVENCIIKNSSNNGVEWIDNINGSFIGNSIQRTGLRAGRGGNGNGTYIGLNITANKNTSGKNIFQYNTIDSTGYIGIDFRTGGTTIKNNLVRNFCMIKDDGAGIYTWGNALGNNQIDGNIVLNGIGCGAGTANKDQLQVHGIYIDDRSADIDLNNNTVAYCGTTGIYVHNAKRLSIHKNKLFNNGSRLNGKENGQLLIKLDALVAVTSKALNLRVTNNLFASLQEDLHCICLAAEKATDLDTLGVFDHNQYIAPQADQVVAKFCGHQNICDAIEELSLSGWQRCAENDKNSDFKKIRTAKTGLVGLNMIKNSRMDIDTRGWISWPHQVSIIHDKKRGVDGPSLKVQFPLGTSEALLYHSGFGLNANKLYRLSFFAKSAVKSKIEFVPLMAIAPWEAVGAYSCFTIDTVFRSFIYVFKPTRSFSDARVNFKSNTTFWIDDVKLQEITNTKTEEPLQLIYNATNKPKAISIAGKSSDLDGNSISNPLVVPAYTSIILKKY